MTFYLSLLISIALSRIVFAALAPAATALSYVVPPPVADGGNAWKDAYTRATELVAEMNLKEKIDMVTGQAGPCAAILAMSLVSEFPECASRMVLLAFDQL